MENVVVFVNERSGGRRGRDASRRMREALGPPHRVFDAAVGVRAIERGEVVWNERTRALVAGGDGTVARVAEALRSARLPPPPLAVAPLGTGNDLARVLGWHGNVWDDAKLCDEEYVVETLRRASVEHVDRWSLEILRPRKKATTKTFMNYLSVGVDARAALAFDLARKNSRWTWLFAHPLLNKFLYALFGSRDFLQHSFAGLKRDVVVVVDDRVIDLPDDTEGIIVLNINSFSGGVTMWTSDERFKKSRKDDGALEIAAVTGALHLGQLNVGAAKPMHVAQGSRVRIELKRKLPVQIDGEPWTQRPAVLRVSLLDSFPMLARSRRDRLADLLGRHRRRVETPVKNDSSSATHRRAFAMLALATLAFAALVVVLARA